MELSTDKSERSLWNFLPIGWSVSGVSLSSPESRCAVRRWWHPSPGWRDADWPAHRSASGRAPDRHPTVQQCRFAAIEWLVSAAKFTIHEFNAHLMALVLSAAAAAARKASDALPQAGRLASLGVQQRGDAKLARQSLIVLALHRRASSVLRSSRWLHSTSVDFQTESETGAFGADRPTRSNGSRPAVCGLTWKTSCRSPAGSRPHSSRLACFWWSPAPGSLYLVIFVLELCRRVIRASLLQPRRSSSAFACDSCHQRATVVKRTV